MARIRVRGDATTPDHYVDDVTGQKTDEAGNPLQIAAPEESIFARGDRARASLGGGAAQIVPGSYASDFQQQLAALAPPPPKSPQVRFQEEAIKAASAPPVPVPGQVPGSDTGGFDSGGNPYLIASDRRNRQGGGYSGGVQPLGADTADRVARSAQANEAARTVYPGGVPGVTTIDGEAEGVNNGGTGGASPQSLADVEFMKNKLALDAKEADLDAKLAAHPMNNPQARTYAQAIANGGGVPDPSGSGRRVLGASALTFQNKTREYDDLVRAKEEIQNERKYAEALARVKKQREADIVARRGKMDEDKAAKEAEKKVKDAAAAEEKKARTAAAEDDKRITVLNQNMTKIKADARKAALEEAGLPRWPSPQDVENDPSIRAAMDAARAAESRILNADASYQAYARQLRESGVKRDRRLGLGPTPQPNFDDSPAPRPAAVAPDPVKLREAAQRAVAAGKFATIEDALAHAEKKIGGQR